MVLTERNFAPGDNWPYLETFLAFMMRREIETRDAAKHPTVHRTGPHNKELPSPSVNSVEVEKS